MSIKISGLVINSSSFKLDDSPDEDLRVVFTYSGLLQADPGAGGYRKVLPGRLVDPAKIVTWTPELATRSLASTQTNIIKYRTVQPKKQGLVTWTPKIQLNVLDREPITQKNRPVKGTNSDWIFKGKSKLRTGLSPIPLDDVWPTSASSSTLATSLRSAEDRATASADVVSNLKTNSETTESTALTTTSTEDKLAAKVVTVLPLLNLWKYFETTKLTTRTTASTTASTTTTATASTTTSTKISTTTSKRTSEPTSHTLTTTATFSSSEYSYNVYSDQGANNFFEWLHDSDSEDSWDDGELLSQSPGQQPLQSSVLSWLASKSKLREQKKKENLGAKISPHYQEMNDPYEMSTLFVYPSPSSNNESSGLIETRNDAEFEGSDLIIHTVDGDVMDYLREFRSEDAEDIQKEEHEVIRSEEPEVIQSEEQEVIQSEEPEVIQSEEPEAIQSEEQEVIRSEEHEVIQSEEQEVIQSEEQEVIRSEEHEVVSDNGDMAQSSLQVRYLPCLNLCPLILKLSPSYLSIPDFLDEEDIIHGDGGVIYVDNDIVTADYSVLNDAMGEEVGEHDDSEGQAEDKGDNFDSVIEHNDKLVNILQNSLEMQAYLFDKVLKFVF